MRRIVSVLSAAAAAGIATLALGMPAAVAGPTGLPSDPQAHGYIGLCDETGHNITGGSIDTVPFVWKAVSSSAPPAQYQGTGQNAILNIFQPRPGTLPGDWSGGPLNAASFYTNKAHPATQFTYADTESLAQFMQAYPPLDNGLYVLRMGYGKKNVGLYSQTYPSTVIQVVGKRWSVVAGGTVDCGASTAVSNEQVTGIATKKQVTPRATAPSYQTVADGAHGQNGSAPITKAPVANASAAGKSGAAGSSNNPADGTATGTPAAASSSTADSGSSGWVWFVVVPAVVIVVLALLLWRRRSAGNTSTAS